MVRPIGIGEDDFAALIQDGCFYIDKTMLIKEWWENRDKVTLITRSRRFGKTLNTSMLERFWSNQYAGQGEIFENLPSEADASHFYHGFVLGLLVDLRDRYEVISNRESGFGRYDVMLRPLNETDDAIILEFKVYSPKKESSLEETVQAALQQIADKKYEQTLINQGIEPQRIRKYGFAFQGKEVLIG